MTSIVPINPKLFEDVKALVLTAKTNVIVHTNYQMTLLYWNMGKRIYEDIMQAERSEYGKTIITSLAKQLSAEFGKGFSKDILYKMVRFHEGFPDLSIVATLSQQLSWSHILELLPLDSYEKRQFYAYMAIESRWSVRSLRNNIHRMTFERTIANQKNSSTKLLEKMGDLLPPLNTDLVLKDPYMLEFLGLAPEHFESDLEAAILREIEKFILELGTGFAFMERQKRISIDDDHFYLDLLFYNRKFKRMVAIELKTGKFKPAYKGQMELYLRYLERYETFEGELPPLGIILCTEKSNHQIELLNMDQSGIHVAEYWTELPPKEVFERKIQEIILRSKEIILLEEKE